MEVLQRVNPSAAHDAVLSWQSYGPQWRMLEMGRTVAVHSSLCAASASDVVPTHREESHTASTQLCSQAAVAPLYVKVGTQL